MAPQHKNNDACNSDILLLCLICKLNFITHRYWRRQWHPTPVLLPGKCHGWRSLVGCSLWGREELDMTEWLHFHFHALKKQMATHSSVLAWRIPGTGEPGGLPSMGSQSRTRLKWLSSSSSCLSNDYVVHMKWTYYYMLIVAQLKWKN